MTAITLDILSGVVMLIIYLLNEMKHYTFARYLFFIFLNAVLFTFANLLPKERGVYLIFFPVIVLTFPMFAPERKNILFFSGLSVCLIIICEVFDYQLFGHVVSDSSQYGSFIANLLLAIGVSVMAINFLVNINEEAKTFLNNLILKWNQKNKELEKANAELDRFVYSTSHELRSPLLSILGLINLLENENEKEKGKDYIRMIKKSITKQDEFISEILQYSRNARLEVTVEAFDLKDFVIDVVDDCRLLEGADSVKFIFDIQANRYIKTDKSRLSIILKNLITNSVK
ncbi:MAG: HAMP domain-containing histidine kinase [Bacteroidetes bacterium]|nr:HAMP domain-containing histidine kinase [Bacteroidota bacterium]